MWGRRRRRGRPLAAGAIVVMGGVAAFSAVLPWFSYSWEDGTGTLTSRLVGLHDVTGRTMFVAGIAEAAFAFVYLRVHAVLAKRWLRGAMVLLAFYMISIPLAAMSNAGTVPGSPAVDVPAGAVKVDATGAIGVVIALLAAFIVLGASWLTVLDSVGETVPKR
jgi:hypothetical protein